jgi:RNA polymerase sigma-70 factor (ECF subfamily)
MQPLSYDEFSSLVLSELDSVTRVARSFARDHSEADDLVQETYARAIASWSRFTLHEFGVRAWLLRILRNVFLNRVAKQSREQQIGDDQFDVAANDEIVPVSDGAIDWNQVDSRLASSVAQLPESLRSTLLLWAIEELKYHEIAEVMAVPIGTVMSRLHRARSMLKTRLESLASERGIRSKGLTE